MEVTEVSVRLVAYLLPPSRARARVYFIPLLSNIIKHYTLMGSRK